MSDRFEKLKPHLIPLLLLLLVTSASYGRMLGHEFIYNWDDSFYVTDNESIQGFSLEHIRTVFSSFYAGNYSPVQMLSYMLDYTLWGIKPAGYLFTNLFIHSLNGLLVYRLLFRLHEERLVATVGAAIFLLHPVQVESVAWVSQRKNLLAMMFFLTAWGGYISYREAREGHGRKAYALSVALFLMSLLSKSVTVIFPLVLLLFDRCYPSAEQRFRYLDKIPYLAAAGVVAVLSLTSQMPDESVWGGGGGRLTGYHGGSAMSTFLTMLPVCCRYLGMLLLPVGLSAEYAPAIHQTFDSAVLVAALLLTVVGILIAWLFRVNCKLGFWTLYFWIALLPVSQIIPLVTLMNDRYLYFPLLGAAALVAAGVASLYRKFPGVGSVSVRILIALVLVLLSVATYQRTSVWLNPITLWSDTVTKIPERSSAWEKLGEAYHAATPSMKTEAIGAYNMALKLAPSSEITLYNLGLLNTELKNYEEATFLLNRLLQNNPDHVMGWAALGGVYQHMGKFAEAEKTFQQAHELQPDALQVVRLLADLSFIQKRNDQAYTYYLQLEEKGWGDAQIAFNMACIEAQEAHAAAAMDWLSKSLARGFKDYGKIVGSSEFSGFLNDSRFQVLLLRYFPQHR